MAILKEVLGKKMTDKQYLEDVCVREANLDEKEKKHFTISTKLVEKGKMFDTHECVISIKSDETLSNLITKRNIIKLLRLMEEPVCCVGEITHPYITRVIDLGSVLSKDKKQMNIIFLIINNIEKLKV